MMFWTLLLGTMPLDPLGDPLPFYLDEPAVVRVLGALPSRLDDCAAGEELTVQLTLTLAGEGGLSVTKISGAEENLQRCIGEAVSSAPSPAHDGVDVVVETTAYLRGASWLMSPSPRILRRVQPPLLLFVPGDDDARSMVWEHLMGAKPGER